MPDSADLVCGTCRLVLPLGDFHNIAERRRLIAGEGPSQDDPTLSAALWKFLAEHVYHEVRLLGEQSPGWSAVDDDYTFIGENVPWSPDLADYVAGWTGHALAVRPRPLVDAVSKVITCHDPGDGSVSWLPGPAERAAMKSLVGAIDRPPGPGQRVDAGDVLRRTARAREAVALLGSVGRGIPDTPTGRLLADCVQVLAEVGCLSPERFTTAPDGFAPPELYEAERALALVVGFMSAFC